MVAHKYMLLSYTAIEIESIRIPLIAAALGK